MAVRCCWCACACLWRFGSGPGALGMKVALCCDLTSLCQVAHLSLVRLWGKDSFSFIAILSGKNRRKLEMLVWSVLATYWRKLEKFRIQSSLHSENKFQRQLMVLESDVHKGILLKHNFLSAITSISAKDNQVYFQHTWPNYLQKCSRNSD